MSTQHLRQSRRLNLLTRGAQIMNEVTVSGVFGSILNPERICGYQCWSRLSTPEAFWYIAT